MQVRVCQLEGTALAQQLIAAMGIDGAMEHLSDPEHEPSGSVTEIADLGKIADLL